MINLSINLTEYGEKLDNLSTIIEKLSKTAWNIETAMMFCEEQGIPVTDGTIRQISSISNTFLELNGFNYNDLQSRMKECKKQCNELIAISDKEYEQYNDAYKTYIKSNLENITKLIDSFFASLSRNQRASEYLNGIKTELCICMMDYIQISTNYLNISNTETKIM